MSPLAPSSFRSRVDGSIDRSVRSRCRTRSGDIGDLAGQPPVQRRQSLERVIHRGHLAQSFKRATPHSGQIRDDILDGVQEAANVRRPVSRSRSRVELIGRSTLVRHDERQAARARLRDEAWTGRAPTNNAVGHGARRDWRSDRPGARTRVVGSMLEPTSEEDEAVSARSSGQEVGGNRGEAGHVFQQTPCSTRDS